MTKNFNSNEKGGIEDVRFREWMNLDTKASKILKLLIETENLLKEVNDISLENRHSYSELKTFYNQISKIREDFTAYVDTHSGALVVHIKNFEPVFNPYKKDDDDISIGLAYFCDTCGNLCENNYEGSAQNSLKNKELLICPKCYEKEKLTIEPKSK